jgi:hypothetical protein
MGQNWEVLIGAGDPGGFAGGAGGGIAEKARHERRGLAAEAPGGVGVAEARVVAQIAGETGAVFGSVAGLKVLNSLNIMGLRTPDSAILSADYSRV